MPPATPALVCLQIGGWIGIWQLPLRGSQRTEDTEDTEDTENAEVTEVSLQKTGVPLPPTTARAHRAPAQ